MFSPRSALKGFKVGLSLSLVVHFFQQRDGERQSDQATNKEDGEEAEELRVAALSHQAKVRSGQDRLDEGRNPKVEICHTA